MATGSGRAAVFNLHLNKDRNTLPILLSWHLLGLSTSSMINGLKIPQLPEYITHDSRFKHRLFRRNTVIHIYITIMDTWQKMFLNGNII